MRVLVLQVIGDLRIWGSAALMIFPAHRRLRQMERENAHLVRRDILRSIEPAVIAENRRLRSTIETAAGLLVAALEEQPATQDGREGLRLVR